MSTTPWLGAIKPLIMRSRVDFPDPDSPITTKISPVLTDKETSCTATRASEERRSSDGEAPGRPPKDFHTCRRRIGSSMPGLFRF